jgi:hypothetical protein
MSDDCSAGYCGVPHASIGRPHKVPNELHKNIDYGISWQQLKAMTGSEGSEARTAEHAALDGPEVLGSRYAHWLSRSYELSSECKHA